LLLLLARYIHTYIAMNEFQHAEVQLLSS